MRRRVVDHRRGVEGLFLGSATFAGDLTCEERGDLTYEKRSERTSEKRGELTFEGRGELTYEERGELTFGAHRGPAARSLLYTDLGGDVFDVRFADGRPFYRLDLGDGGWSAEHPCRDDTYTVKGQITGPDTFTEHWHATGPDKDYELLTTYERDGNVAARKPAAASNESRSAASS